MGPLDENEATLAAYDGAVATYLDRTPSEPSALARWLGGLVGEVFAPGARVLEIGAAGGQDAAYLQDQGLEVLPTDASAGFVEHLREHGFTTAQRYDLRRDTTPEGPWDIVFANAVLPHLRRRDVTPALRRLHDSLDDETALFASVKIGEGEGWSTEKLGTLRWYTYWQPEDFVRALADAGWVVEEARVRTGRFDDWVSVVALPARAALRDAFDDRAASYRRSQWHREYAAQLVAATPLQPGWTVLDAATGTGFVAREVARRVGPAGRVLALDLSEGMLDQLAAASDGASGERGATGMAAAPGLAPIEPMVADAMAVPLPDGCVDAVTCGAGLLYMDPQRALAEWHRLLRPGGVVAFSTMLADHPPAWGLFRSHAAAYGMRVTDLSAALGSPQACRHALVAAGFVEAQITPGVVTMSEADLEQAWDVNARMVRGEFACLPEEDVGRLRASYVAETQLRLRTDPDFRRAHTLYAVGRRP